MAQREWTEEQKLAITAESGTVLVSAAAGSGKTSVLVERIVRKLTDPLRPTPPEALLVVTFTNAAAAEMRSRIFRRIREKAETEPENAAALGALSARLGEMAVCTMDSFCMQLVRENFSDCGLEPDFGMLDEGEETSMKKAAVSRVIETLYEEADPAFTGLTALFEGGRDDSGLISGILALSDFSMSEPDPAGWLDGVASAFSPVPAADSVWGRLLLARMRRGLAYALRLTDAALEEVAEDARLAEKNAPLLELDRFRLTEAQDALAACDWDTAYGAVSHALAEISSRRFSTPRGMADDPVKRRVLGKRNEVRDLLKGLCGLYCATEAENAEDVAALTACAAALTDAVKRFNEALLADKKEANRFGFADISHFALGLLYDPAAADGKTPLARELAEGYAEILIDEYQDTNRAQDSLFNALSKNGENMFMVGDVKQSIYRFRLASPEIFTEKCRDFPPYDGVAKRSKIILDKNFRSRREVTETVNYMFSAVMSRDYGEIDYTGGELLDPAAQYPESRAHDTEFYLIEAGEADALAAEAAFAASLIRSKLDEGLTVSGKDGPRPAGYGDFCVLLRAARGPAQVYAAALRDAGIPVDVDARDGFFSTAEVRMLLSLLRAIDNPLRDVELFAVMLSPLGGFGAESAARIRVEAGERTGRRDLPLYHVLQSAAENGDAASLRLLETLAGFRKAAAAVSADELIRRIFDETPVLHVVGAKDGGALRVADLHALYETAVGFCADGPKGLGAFLRYLDTLQENGADLRGGSVPVQKNCVSIMTMHRSKGLEFPFVIIGGLNRRFNLRQASDVLGVSHEYGVGLKRREPENVKLYDTLSSLSVRAACRDASLSEEMRIYYVAMTRAREKLFLLAGCKDPRKKLAETEAVLPQTDRVPPVYVGGASSPLSWFLAAFLRHPCAAGLRTLTDYVVPADFRMTCAVAQPPEEAAPPAPPAQAEADGALTADLVSRMRFSYRYAPVAAALSKHTASTLREETFSPLHFAQSAPAFMYRDGAAPTDVGTATHRFLELCDFSSASPDVEAELARLTAEGRLTQAEAKLVSTDAVRTFFASDVFRRVLASERVLREREFTVAKSVCELDPSVPAEFADEMTVVIGKTDLVFIEDGKAVIVDYKTDRVEDVSLLPARYAAQLRLYADAVRQAWGYEVKEMILYSLYKKEYVNV